MYQERDLFGLRSTIMWFQWLYSVLAAAVIVFMMFLLLRIDRDSGMMVLWILVFIIVATIPLNLRITYWVEVDRVGITRKTVLSKSRQIVWQDLGRAQLRVIRQSNGKNMEIMVFSRRMPEGSAAKEKDQIQIQLHGDGLFCAGLSPHMEKAALMRLLSQRGISVETVEQTAP